MRVLLCLPVGLVLGLDTANSLSLRRLRSRDCGKQAVRAWRLFERGEYNAQSPRPFPMSALRALPSPDIASQCYFPMARKPSPRAEDQHAKFGRQHEPPDLSDALHSGLLMCRRSCSAYGLREGHWQGKEPRVSTRGNPGEPVIRTTLT